ncbi:SAC3 family protein C isoform X1 [Iris pallida]|uniref:SAC3 family protein C isoform X1 n=1 Tax=Iris pallida TaxID=29817 RepID=A0AAX6IJK6_IRIPA|nr:SAC3 family protein C isoform X1 [Iris pallida]
MEKKSSSNRRQELGFHGAPSSFSSSSSNWRRSHPTNNHREKEEEERPDPIAMVGTCPDMCPDIQNLVTQLYCVPYLGWSTSLFPAFSCKGAGHT